jgi:uncharacterized membrane protein YedE/YeeE
LITRITGLLFGAGFGFLMSWAGLSDATVIRNMLLLREGHVFLFMGSAVLVAAVGLRLLRAFRLRAGITGEPIAWSLDRIERRHIIGSLLFGAGWSLAGTCPGPVAAMIGQGKLGGLLVAGGMLAGVSLQGALARRRIAVKATQPIAMEGPGTTGL